MKDIIAVHNSGFLNFGVDNIRRLMNLEGAIYLDDYAWVEDQAWTLFYTPVLRKPEHSHYWGVRRFRGDVYIRSIEDKLPLWFQGVYYPEGNAFVYSRTVHDFYSPPDIPFSIDGGGAYLRLVGNVDFKRDILNAQFNPETMEIKVGETVIGQGEYASAARRSLRS